MNNGFYIGSILIVSYDEGLSKHIFSLENRKYYQKAKFKWMLS